MRSENGQQFQTPTGSSSQEDFISHHGLNGVKVEVSCRLATTVTHIISQCDKMYPANRLASFAIKPACGLVDAAECLRLIGDEQRSSTQDAYRVQEFCDANKCTMTMQNSPVEVQPTLRSPRSAQYG